MSATGKMPPLPDLDPTTIGLTPQESQSYRTGQSLYTGLGEAPEFEKSYAAQQIGTAHATRMATAQRHYHAAQTYFQILQGGQSPTQTNPDGTAAPLSPDEKQNYQTLLNGAWDDLSKVAGIDKDTKAELQNRKQMMDTYLQHGHARVAQVAGALANQDAAPGTGNMPAPPSPITPPAPAPSAENLFGSPPGLMAPLLAQTTQPAALARAGTQQNVEAAKTSDIMPGTRDYESAVLEHRLPALHTPNENTYVDTDGKMFTGYPSPGGGSIINADTQQPVAGATKVTAGMLASPTIVGGTGDTPPYAVKRNGQTLMPDDPNFTAHDKELLDSAKASFDKAQATKTKRQQDFQSSYAKMRGQVYQYQVMDLASGNPAYVNANEINANPGKYAPLGQAQTLKNRDTVFNEINYSAKQLDSALGKLNDSEDFNTETRAKLAFALRATDPQAAVQTLVNEGALGQLSENQQDFVTALVSAQESAMALRSIAGMGAGSDMLRGAIQNMLPSAGTPTKRYGLNQMRLYHGQIDQLHQAIPPAVRGMGAGASQFTEGQVVPGDADTPPGDAPAGMKWQYSDSRKAYKLVRKAAGEK